MVELVLEPDLAQDLAGASSFACAFGHLLHGARRERDVLLDRQVRKQVVALEDDADILAQRAQVGLRVADRWPHTTISPLSIGSKPSMQRSAVLLPEPLRPMTARISPRSTSKRDAVEHLERPKLLCTCVRRRRCSGICSESCACQAVSSSCGRAAALSSRRLTARAGSTARNRSRRR